MDSFVKYLSLAPVILILWLGLTATILIIINNIYPDLLSLPL
ncbi:Photosystem I reaction center subunit IX [Phormidium sp. CCY1219]|nr:Photosystem I reaction center subunit IX [Phormidium sp. CCY1219]MEB3829381.1 Photosystem I reaction center subunit IX [Phormidium sp. CCY1219]